jgi:hypothetical protein
MAPKKESRVWEYFEPNARGISQCKLCSNRIHHASSTSNIWSHLRVNHRNLYDTIRTQKQSSVDKTSLPRTDEVLRSEDRRRPVNADSMHKDAASPTLESSELRTLGKLWCTCVPLAKKLLKIQEPEELINRLILLLASRECGNHHVTTEIEEIENTLRQMGVIL